MNSLNRPIDPVIYGIDTQLHIRLKNAKLQARLKWAAACERLAFALDPPSVHPPDDAPDLEVAVRLVQAALEGVREAFKVNAEGGGGADRASLRTVKARTTANDRS